MKHLRFGIFFVIALWLCGCKSNGRIDDRNELARYYSEYRLSGNFVMYDLKKDHYTYYNSAQAQVAYPPGSTFKLLLSLVGFETGNIASEGDEVTDQMKSTWKPEHEVKSAYRNSAVHFYEDLTRKIGEPEIKTWLDRTKYGNADTTGGIPGFWQTGGLKITPEEQITFLRRLHEHKLPFSGANMDKVIGMMTIKDTAGYSIKGKTGWAEQDNADIGWFVGYVDTKDDTYFFANCIQSSDPGNPYFENARMDITYKILKDMRVIPQQFEE